MKCLLQVSLILVFLFLIGCVSNQPICRLHTHWDATLEKCVPNVSQCAPNEYWNESFRKCMPN